MPRGQVADGHLDHARGIAEKLGFVLDRADEWQDPKGKGPARFLAVLHGRATGDDPILFSPMCEVAAAPAQYVELCVKCTAPAMAELYWTETLQGPYGGFSPEKHRLFHAQGDAEFHVYRIWPFWQAASARATPSAARLRITLFLRAGSNRPPPSSIASGSRQ